MDSETYARVREVFEAVIEIAPEKRRAAAERACDGDKAVLEEVESLLTFHRATDRNES